ncbi:MAG: hypothetical protein QHJ73_14405, partial [Armatimonadota bacterium]|nr:hypothetical protein [Armatimonadota bacterium]
MPRRKAGARGGVVRMAEMPNTWGAGQLFAFSGVDGHTDWARPFVLQTGASPGSLRVCLPFAAAVEFPGLEAPRFRWVLGDAIEAEAAGGRFRAVFT